MWRTPHLSALQKLYWTYLLMYREMYPLVSLQVFSLMFSMLLWQGSLPLLSHWFLWGSAAIMWVPASTCASIPPTVWSSCTRPDRARPRSARS